VITEANLSLVPATHPALWTPARPVDDIPLQVLPHIDAMRELMRSRSGLGLAAPQVGIGLRFFISSIVGLPIAINPRVVSTFGGRSICREGCLTWPGRVTRVSRFNGIRAVYTGRDGIERSCLLSGLNARVFQHETDHCGGFCIFSQPQIQP
jgi:peptide deformylase